MPWHVALNTTATSANYAPIFADSARLPVPRTLRSTPIVRNVKSHVKNVPLNVTSTQWKHTPDL